RRLAFRPCNTVSYTDAFVKTNFDRRTAGTICRSVQKHSHAHVPEVRRTVMANNAFLKIDGIIGPVTSAGHYGEVEILAFSFSGQQSAAPSKPQPPPYDNDKLVVVKKSDSISNRLVEAVATGDHFGTVALTLEGAEGKNAGVRF